MTEFLNVISLVLNSTYFKFDNRYFKQIFGMLMGVSTDLSGFSYSRLRKSTFFTSTLISIYYQYMNDILLAVLNNRIEY